MIHGIARYSNGLSLRDAADQLMESAFLRPSLLPSYAGMGTWTFPLNVFVDSDNYYVFLAVPGVKADSVEITSLNNVLSVSGETESPAGEDWRPLIQEQTYGRFQREVSLPAPFSADTVQATFENGILKITVPKAAHQRVQKINVTTKS